MLNAVNFGIVDHKNLKAEVERVKVDQNRNTRETPKDEESKVEKFRKSIESGSYALDMDKTARALVVGF